MKVKEFVQGTTHKCVAATTTTAAKLITPAAKRYTEHKALQRAKNELKGQMILEGLALLERDARIASEAAALKAQVEQLVANGLTEDQRMDDLERRFQLAVKQGSIIDFLNANVPHEMPEGGVLS